MTLQFTKMHGLGNDYVFVSLFDQHVEQPAALARAISDRHRGVGSDGLILIAPAPDERCDARMIVYNADGSRAQMCGNGIRCVAKYVYERGIARRTPLCIATDVGPVWVDLTVDEEDRVRAARVDLGEPILAARQIPVNLDSERVVAVPLELDGKRLTMTCVSLGNPHAVFFTAELESVPLAQWGPAIEHHPLFPERINVHFAQVVAPDRIRVRSWERGSGLTQACGSGAAACCVAGVLNGLTARSLTAELPGGELQLTWDAETDHLFLTGPAEEVFSGSWPLPA
jgi:diaminopimelate epimerase